MKFSILLASTLASIALAQSYPEITADDVDQNTRDFWCTNQLAVCPLLCQDQSFTDAQINDCWSEDLTYACVCKDGKTPNLDDYSLTIPFHKCQASVQKCADNCQGEENCANLCFTGKKCGAKSPPKPKNSTSTVGPTSSATGSPTGTSSGTSKAMSTNDDPFDQSLASHITGAMSAYGFSAMVLSMAAGFGYFL